jgi:hypothetical protein
MRKIATGLLVLGMLVSAAPALAATDTTIAGCVVPPDHGIYDEMNHLVGCITAGAWNAGMSAQNHGTVLPVFFYPQTVTDAHGVTYACEAFLVHGCVDATKTPEYQAYMQGLARQLIASHTEVPAFDGWVASVR